jgi:Legume lectin domain.
MTASNRSGGEAVRRWLRRPRGRRGRARFVVSLVGVIALAGTLTAVLTATAGTQGDEVSLSNAQISALTEAATSCPDLRPARLAGQVMAATGFAPTAEGGIGGLTADEWEIWKPWESARPSDERASLLALAHLTCDLIGRLRVAGLPQAELWRLAMAAFAASLHEVVTVGGIPASAAEFVAAVERYTAAYERVFGTGSDRVPASDLTPRTPATPTDPASFTPSATTSASAGPATPSAPAATPARPEPPTSISFAGFPTVSNLTLNGSAEVRDNRLYLVDGPSETGSAWATTMLPTTRSFTTTFTVVGTGHPNQGLAFVIQAQGPGALGQGGEGTGYGGIRPSVVVEFDTGTSPSFGDPPGLRHVAVTLNGDASRHLVWGDPGYVLFTGEPFSAWIEYDASTKLLSVYVARAENRPAAPLITYTVDLRATLGVDRAYVGFTGATAGADHLTSLVAWSLVSG